MTCTDLTLLLTAIANLIGALSSLAAKLYRLLRTPWR